MPKPCAWCNEDNMDWAADPNTGDVCVFCIDEALEQEEEVNA